MVADIARAEHLLEEDSEREMEESEREGDMREGGNEEIMGREGRTCTGCADDCVCVVWYRCVNEGER